MTAALVLIAEDQKPRAVCSFLDCSASSKWKGYCEKHYYVVWRRLNKDRTKEYKDQIKDKYNAWQRRHRKLHPEIHHERARTIKMRMKTGIGGAKRRGYEWSISQEQFELLVQNVCHYCAGSLPPCGSGLDRKDNDKGYTMDNVVPCCKVCNLIKGDRLTYEEMKAVGNALIDFRNKNAA